MAKNVNGCWAPVAFFRWCVQGRETEVEGGGSNADAGDRGERGCTSAVCWLGALGRYLMKLAERRGRSTLQLQLSSDCAFGLPRAENDPSRACVSAQVYQRGRFPVTHCVFCAIRKLIVEEKDREIRRFRSELDSILRELGQIGGPLNGSSH